MTVLRNVTTAVSEGLAEHVHDAQKAQLLGWLKEANDSKGRRKIVLAVGRDGIMLPIRGEATYKEGAVATIAVYDRRGRRLGTVYLGQMPEAYQVTLSEQLTRLVSEVLAEWDGPWPRLVYITDAGYHPTEYFDNVLKQLAASPASRSRDGLDVDRRLLSRLRVHQQVGAGIVRRPASRTCLVAADATLAEAETECRVSHSPLGSETPLRMGVHTRKKRRCTKQRTTTFTATRTTWTTANYRRTGLPIGSGVTEAACKTVFTQRFKESGMSWGIEGGQVILTLRLAHAEPSLGHSISSVSGTPAFTDTLAQQTSR